jgi:hypothetical protein
MNTLEKIIVSIAGFMPLILVAFFANPQEGIYSKSVGTLATLFIA